MTARVDHAVTTGTFSLDGGTWEVDNNVWVIGDDSECIVIDAPHDADTIVEVVGERAVRALVLTHGHDDHIDAALEVARRTGATTYLHPADRMLWDWVHQEAPGAELEDGMELAVAGVTLRVLHTPGHSPGACSLYVPELGALFSGDTLFEGGPGATGRSFSDFPTIIDSITHKLLTLPEETVVHTGHGGDTTIGAERPSLQEWADRGW